MNACKQWLYLVPGEEGEEVDHVKLVHDNGPGSVGETREKCDHLTVHVKERQEQQGRVDSGDGVGLTGNKTEREG